MMDASTTQETTMSQTLSITVADGSFDCFVEYPSTPGPHPVVIVVQEIFGVNAGIRSIARNYALKGYIAVAPDLFWRAEPGLQLTEAEFDQAFALYQEYDVDKGVQDIAAVIAAARKLDGSNGKVGVTGFCLGGLLTYLSAARTDADAFAAYYGGGTDNYLAEAANITAPVIYHLAGADAYLPPPAQEAIRAALAKTPDAEVYVYEGRDHAFARPNGSHHHEGDTVLANGRTDAFFMKHLH
jgi:carboxymethylenebutenolidase